ncbi:MAG: glycoside hydrolase family 57 protein [candidate division WOR-3 bacterium]
MRVLFLWHMHQPAYFLNEDGKRIYYLPWVLQHALKEYYEMPYMVSRFDGVKVTFNLVPILLEQLQDYANGRAHCRFSEIAKKPADSLTEEEIKFILYHFFNISERTRIRPFHRFYYLYRKRGKVHEIEERWKYFTVQDLRDIQFYWLFSAISPVLVSRNLILRELSQKKEKYKEEDKAALWKLIPYLIKETINLYFDLAREGRVEISGTPYYHPILPVLYNSKNAEISNPYTRRPNFTFSEPENARKHIQKTINYFREQFGYEIKGMWPAEGAVSSDTIPLYKEHGIKWIATDEEILLKSLKTGDRDRTYYFYELDGIKIFFRDRELSDLIGFAYSQRSEVESAMDFFEKLRALYHREKKLVSIILDGENPWDSYPERGFKFLETLYSLLNKCTRVVTSTFSEVCEEEKPEPLFTLHPGSWIRGDFTTWTGHPEKDKAWKYLHEVKTLVKDSLTPIAEEELMCSEGSDWFWWYGDDNFTIYFREFDELFRGHLKKAVQYAGKSVPPFLDEPIKTEIQSVTPDVHSAAYIEPRIDGVVENYYEYLGAGEFNVKVMSTGSMQSKTHFLEKIYFGFGREKFYLMLKPQPSRQLDKVNIYFEDGRFIEIDLKHPTPVSFVEFAYKKVVEIGIVKEFLPPHLEIKFHIIVNGEGLSERYPRVGSFKIKRLTDEEIDWVW